MSARWGRADGTEGEATVQLRLEAAERFYIVRVIVDLPTTEKLRDVPLARIEAAVNGSPRIHGWIEKSVPEGIKRQRRQKIAERPRLERPAGRQLDDSFYRTVAACYKGAKANGLPPWKDARCRQRHAARHRRPLDRRSTQARSPGSRRARKDRLAASSWLEKRLTGSGDVRWCVRYRVGGRDEHPPARRNVPNAARRAARARRGWCGELAAMRVPDVRALAEPAPRRPPRRRAALAGEPRRRRREHRAAAPLRGARDAAAARRPPGRRDHAPPTSPTLVADARRGRGSARRSARRDRRSR